jgi:hypothetical protein
MLESQSGSRLVVASLLLSAGASGGGVKQLTPNLYDKYHSIISSEFRQ